MTQAQWNQYALSSAQDEQLTEDLNFVTQYKQNQYNLLNAPDDADSAEAWRLLGGDAPEVFHDIKPTGDTKNARSKVYRQVAHDNDITIQEAVTLVDSQAEAYKTDQAYRDSVQFRLDKAVSPDDPYYQSQNISDAIATFRKTGDVKGDLTSYDFYNAGDKAFAAAKADSILNPETSLFKSQDFLTGESGAFGRKLSDNKEYVDRQIAAGLMIPGSNDTKEYKLQTRSMEKAKRLKVGNYGETNVDPRVMETIFETSYGQRGKTWSHKTRNRITNAVKAAGSTIAGAGYGIVDATSELIGWVTGGAIGGDIATSEEIDTWANDLTGYDASYTAQASDEIKSLFVDWQEGKITLTDFIISGGIAGLKAAPEAAASSLAFVATLFAPGKVLQGFTKMGKVLKAETLGMSAIDKAAKTKEIYAAASTVEKLAHTAVGQAGFIGASIDSTSGDMDAYKAETGEDMSITRTLSSMGINMLMHNLDGFIDKKIITSSGIGSKKILDLISGASDGAKLKLAKELAARGFGVASDTILKEVPTEIIQSGMEAVSQQYVPGQATVADILTSQETLEEMAVSALMTPGSVAGMKAYGAIPQIPGLAAKGAELVQKGVDAVKTKQKSKVSKKVDKELKAETSATRDRAINFIILAEEALTTENNAKAIHAYVETGKEIDKLPEGTEKEELTEKQELIRVKIAEKIRPIADTLMTEADIDEETIRPLGSEETPGSKEAKEENTATYQALIEAIEGTVTDPKLKKRLIEVAAQLDITAEEANAIIIGESADRKLRKTLEEVETEVVEDYSKYMHNIQRYRFKKDKESQVIYESNLDKLATFTASQSRKASRIATGIEEAEDIVSTEVEKMVKDYGQTREEALQTLVNQKENPVVLEIEYTSGSPRGINQREVAAKLLDSDTEPAGMYKIYDAAKASVAAMTEWANVKKIDLQLDKVKKVLEDTGDLGDALIAEANTYKTIQLKKDKAIKAGASEKVIADFDKKLAASNVRRDKLQAKRVKKPKTTGTETQLPEDKVEVPVEAKKEVKAPVTINEIEDFEDFHKSKTKPQFIKMIKEIMAKQLSKTEPTLKEEQFASTYSKEIGIAYKSMRKKETPVKPVEQVTEAKSAPEAERIHKVVTNYAEEIGIDMENLPDNDWLLYTDTTSKELEVSIELGAKTNVKLDDSVAKLIKQLEMSTERETDLKEAISKLYKGIDVFNQEMKNYWAEIIPLLEEQKELKTAKRKHFSAINRLIRGIRRHTDTLKTENLKPKEQMDIMSQVADYLKKIVSRTLDFIERMKRNKGLREDELQKIDARLGHIAQSLEILYEGKEEAQKKKDTVYKEIRAKQVPLEKVKETKAAIQDELTGTNLSQSMLDNTFTRGEDWTKKDGTRGYENISGQIINVDQILEVNKQASTTLASLHTDQLGAEVKAMADAAAELLKGIIMPTEGKTGQQASWLKDSPARGLLFGKDGTVNKNTAAAIAMVTEEFMAFSGSSLQYNTVEDIARMLGVTEFEVSGKIATYLKSKGTFKKLAASELGQNVFGALALKARKDVSIETAAKIKADMGQMVLLYMQEKGYIQPLKDTSEPIIEFVEAVGKREGDTLVSEATVPFVRVSEKADFKESKATYEKLNEILALEGNRKTPSFYKLKKAKSEDVRNNEVTNVPEESKKVLNKLVQEEYTMDVESVEKLLTMGKDRVLEILGYITKENLEKMAFDSKESAEARNREIEASYDYVVEMKETIDGGQNNAMWFDWFFSRNGRYMMNTNTINPQTDKLHRFLFTPKSHRVTIDPEKTADFKVFKMSIAQAFGMAVDKKSTKDVMAFADAILASDMKELVSVLNGAKVEKAGTELEIEELSHMLTALGAIEAYKKADGSSFETTHTMEFDAVTSGFILKLMQMPILRDTKKWLAKGGIFFGDTDVESMNDELAKVGFLDSYQTLASEVKIHEPAEDPLGIWGMVKDKLPEILNEDGSVTDAGRKLFKGPFMTFGYGSALKTIKKRLGYDMIEDIPTLLLSGEIDLEAFAKTVGINSVKLRKELKTKSFEDIRIGKKKLGEELRSLIEQTYGAEVERILTENFAETIEANTAINSAFKMMFRAYNIRYQEEIEKLGTLPTAEQKIEIILGLRDSFPLIKAPFSKDSSDSLVIVGSGLQSSSDYKLGAAQTHIQDGTAKGTSLKVQSMIREFEEAISAGAVVPIHYVDGSIISKVLAMSGVLGVHDAILPSLLEAVKTVKEYNKQVYEINKNYSMIDEILTSLERSYNSLTPKQRTKVAPIETFSKDEKGKSIKIESSFDEVLESTRDLRNTVEKNRAELYKEKATIVHMAALPGTSYEVDGSETKYTETKAEDAIMSQQEIDILYDKATNGVSDKLLEGVNEYLDKCKG